MLYGCETWPASSEIIRRLTSADKSMVSDLNNVLELKKSTKNLLELVFLKISDGAGLDTLDTSREWIQMFGQEE